MKRMPFLLSGLVVALASTQPAMQARPDFSGLWKQNMELSSKTSLQSYANRVEQKDDTLKVTTIMGGSRGESSYDRTYVIGRESQSADKEGDRFTTVVKWDGQSLVFVTTEQEQTGQIVTRETWTLSADGKTLTKVHASHGPRGDSEQRYVLVKSSECRICD